jgi:hypothetical protein
MRCWPSPAGSTGPSAARRSRQIVSPSSGRRTLYGFLDRLNLPGPLPDLRLPRPQRDQPPPRRHHRGAAGPVPDEPPVRPGGGPRDAPRPDVASAGALAPRVDRLYRLLYGRAPTDRETELAAAYLADAGATPVAWERYVQALLMANEFVFID